MKLTIEVEGHPWDLLLALDSVMHELKKPDHYDHQGVWSDAPWSGSFQIEAREHMSSKPLEETLTGVTYEKGIPPHPKFVALSVLADAEDRDESELIPEIIQQCRDAIGIELTEEQAAEMLQVAKSM